MHLVLHGSRYAMYTCVHIKHWTCDRYLWALGLWICVEAKSTSMSSVDSFSAEDELKKLSQRLGCKIGILSCTYVIEYVCWLCCMIVQYALMHSHSRICKVLHVSLWQPLQGLTRVLVLRSFCGKNPFVLLHRLSQLQWNPLRRSVLKLMMQVMNNHHWFRNPWWLSWKKLLLNLQILFLGYIWNSPKELLKFIANWFDVPPSNMALRRSTQAAVKAETTSPSHSAAPGTCQTVA